jgi:hypothetical protein
MSKFPIVEQLSVPQAANFNAPQVVSADTSAVPEATAKLGQVLEKTGGVILDIKQRQDKFNYSIAKSQFLQQNVNYVNKLEQDPDYTNLPDKYDTGTKQIQDNILKSLGNNTYAPLLKQEMDLHKAQNYGQILKVAEAKQQAFGVATAQKQEDANLEAFLAAKDLTSKQAILSATKENYSYSIPESNPNRALLIQKYDEDINKRFVTADIVKKSPQEQINILNAADKDTGKKGIARLIPADERMKLKDRAEMLLEQQKNDAERAIAKADRQAKLNVDNELLKGASSGVAFDQLPIAVQLKASNEDVARYEAIRQKQLGLKQVEPSEQEKNYWQYRDDFQNNPQKFAEVSPLEIAANVPLNKQKEVLSWQQKSTAPVTLVTFDNVANGTLRQAGINLATKDGKNQAAKFKDRLNQESEAFTESHKRQPTAKELQDIAHGLVVKQSFEGTIWGTNEKRVYQMPKGKAMDIVVPEDFKNQVIREKKANGINSPTTEEDFKKIYLKNKKIDLSYNLPEDANSPEDIQRAFEDEAAKNPVFYDGIDIKERSKEIYKRYYRNNQA